MPFKEKIAWIALVGIVGAFVAYFGMIAIEPHPDPYRFIGFFVAVLGAQLVITIVASIVVAVLSPDDAKAPRDERDRLIARRAAGTAYVVLLVGIILAMAVAHLHIGFFGMMNALLAAIMIAEAARFALQIRGYRNG